MDNYIDMDSKMKGPNGVSSPSALLPPSPPPPPPYTNRRRFMTPKPTTTNETTSLESSESEELQRLVHAPPFWKTKKRLSKQLSMCETPRDKAWEKRRRHQILKQERKKKLSVEVEDLTDEDFDELKGSIELGFGFNEEAGQQLCNTLPALDLYFAVNRQLSTSPVSTPHSQGSINSTVTPSSSLDSPISEDSWKICGPGDSPQQVKTKLRHWAQVVACSVMQSF